MGVPREKRGRVVSWCTPGAGDDRESRVATRIEIGKVGKRSVIVRSFAASFNDLRVKFMSCDPFSHFSRQMSVEWQL